MTARLVHRIDGKWHIEVQAEDGDAIDTEFFVALGAVRLNARMLGGLMVIEAHALSQRFAGDNP